MDGGGERGEEGRERRDGRERGRWLQSDAADRSDEKIYGRPKTSLYLIVLDRRLLDFQFF